MLKNKEVDTKIKGMPQALLSNEISGNDREKALSLKAEHDENLKGKKKKMIQVKPGLWKEIYE